MSEATHKVVNIEMNIEQNLNQSGIQPVDMRVLVEPMKTETVTKGGIVLTQQTTEMEDRGHVKARLISVGIQAFEDIKSVDHRPKAGAIVTIAKYAGYLITGKDGKEYRIINDTDVVAVLESDFDIRMKK